jgi:hypothetical protein
VRVEHVILNLSFAVTLSFSLAVTLSAVKNLLSSLRVSYVKNRRLRRLFASRWDGTNAHGSRVAVGVYMYKLVTELGSRTGRVTLVQ